MITNRSSGLFLSLYLLLSVALLFPASAFAGKNPTKVRDLAYGSVLYAYFQQDYFTALSELLIADHQETIKLDKEKSKLLRSGIYLSYGMDREAESILREVVASNSEKELGKNKSAAQENLARAWFYLGKLRYSKGHYQQAVESFARVNKSLSDSLAPEYAFLSESSVLHRSQLNPESVESIEAASLFSYQPRVSGNSSWSYYRDYNQLLEELNALSEHHTAIDRNAGVDIARSMMDIAFRIGKSEELANAEELLALRDQIYTSAGFLFLQVESPQAAMDSFRQVRQGSVLSGQALLGYGWAAANAADYRKALTPWQQLAGLSMLEATTHEALLAVPFAYEKLGADAAALESYDASVSALQSELQLLNRIDDYLLGMPAGKLSEYYLADSVQWLEETSLENSKNKARFADEVLENRMLDLLSQNQYSFLEKQRQDIQWLLARLENWEQDLASVRQVVNERQQRRLNAINEDSLQQLANRLEALRARREGLQARRWAIDTSTLGDTTSIRELMQADELAVQKRIDRAQASINRISESEFQTELFTDESSLQEHRLKQRQLRLIQGMLHWQVSNESVDRSWKLDKALRDIDLDIAVAEQKLSGLVALVDSNQLEQQELQRAEEIQEQIARQKQKALQLAGRIDKRILAMIRDDVIKLRRRTTAYLAQSSMARARLLDTLSEEGEELPIASTGGAR